MSKNAWRRSQPQHSHTPRDDSTNKRSTGSELKLLVFNFRASKGRKIGEGNMIESFSVNEAEYNTKTNNLELFSPSEAVLVSTKSHPFIPSPLSNSTQPISFILDDPRRSPIHPTHGNRDPVSVSASRAPTAWWLSSIQNKTVKKRKQIMPTFQRPLSRLRRSF